jgi:adenylate kinase family enzyme
MPAAQPVELGRRIVVWGATGSGKTTLARRVAEAYRLPHIELDAIRHDGDWDAVDFPEMRARLQQHLDASPEAWVIDGSYSPTHDLYLPHAESLIWLHLPWRISFWRLFKRTLGRARRKQPAYGPHGPFESWRMTFLTRRSILWWSISHHRAQVRLTRDRIAALPPHIRIYELRSDREVSALLARLEQHSATI